MILLLFLFVSWIQWSVAENVYCTYYRETNEVTCGYRIGMMQIRHDTSWFNLYRRRASGSGYWDFYTNIPERNCVGGFGMHAGENIAGSVTVKEKSCFDRLVYQIERKSTSEKFDVHQCRKCIFHSCWLGSRLLPAKREYLTNLRSY